MFKKKAPKTCSHASAPPSGAASAGVSPALPASVSTGSSRLTASFSGELEGDLVVCSTFSLGGELEVELPGSAAFVEIPLLLGVSREMAEVCDIVPSATALVTVEDQVRHGGGRWLGQAIRPRCWESLEFAQLADDLNNIRIGRQVSGIKAITTG